MKKFSQSLREHAMETANFKKKKTKLLTNEQHKSYQNARICKFEKINILKDKDYCKVSDYCHYKGEYRGAIHNM